MVQMIVQIYLRYRLYDYTNALCHNTTKCKCTVMVRKKCKCTIVQMWYLRVRTLKDSTSPYEQVDICGGKKTALIPSCLFYSDGESFYAHLSRTFYFLTFYIRKFKLKKL